MYICNADVLSSAGKNVNINNKITQHVVGRLGEIVFFLFFPLFGKKGKRGGRFMQRRLVILFSE